MKIKTDTPLSANTGDYSRNLLRMSLMVFTALMVSNISNSAYGQTISNEKISADDFDIDTLIKKAEAEAEQTTKEAERTTKELERKTKELERVTKESEASTVLREAAEKIFNNPETDENDEYDFGFGEELEGEIAETAREKAETVREKEKTGAITAIAKAANEVLD